MLSRLNTLAFVFLAAVVAAPQPASARRSASSGGQRSIAYRRALTNLRDAGVLAKVRLGRVYRSDDPRYNRLGTCERLRKLGIKTVIKLNAHQRWIDFNYAPEWRRRGPCGIRELRVSFPHGSTVGAWKMSIYDLERAQSDKGRVRVGGYLRHQMRLLFGELAKLRRRDYPILVNCSYGRDRTGVVVALLQRLAGAARKDVVADYLASNVAYPKAMAWSLKRTMRRLSNWSTVGYLRGLGLTNRAIYGLQYYLSASDEKIAADTARWKARYERRHRKRRPPRPAATPTSD